MKPCIKTWIAAIAFGVALINCALAQSSYPERPIKWIVPFPAGGSADAVPRMISQRLSPKYNIVIENRTGASGNIGADAVAKASADGYTFLASTPAPIVVNRYLYKSVPYSADALAPITVFGRAPIVLVVRKQLPVNSLAEFIAYARTNPGKVTVANQGIGTTSHLASVQLASLVNIKLSDIPYRGSNPAMTDLMSGQVDAFFDVLTSARPAHESAAVKILAVSGERRAVNVPLIATFAEQGVPDFTASTWFALLAPKGLPLDIANRVHADVIAVLKTPDVLEQFRKMDVEPAGLSQVESLRFIELERGRWKAMAEAANVKLD